jgi:hypothetical protein
MTYGAQSKVGLARQASAGTAVTDATSYFGLGFVSHDVGLEKEEVVSQNLIGRFEQGAVYDGINRVTGTIESEITVKNLLASLAFAVNHSPASVTSASIRTHTWLPNTTDFSSTLVKAPWTMYSQFTDSNSAEQYYDLQAGQHQLVIQNGQFSRVRVTVPGGSRTPTGTGSANIVADAADASVLFPWNVCSISINGSGISEFSDLTITLNENVDALYTCNASLNPYKFTRTAFREVTISGTLLLASRALFNDFVASTQRRLLVTMMNTRTAIQSGYFNTLTIDVPQMKFTNFKLPIAGPGEVSVPFTARGVIDPSSNYAIQYTTISTWQSGF